VPKYFDKVVMKLYLVGLSYITSKIMSPFIGGSQDSFVRVPLFLPLPLLLSYLLSS